MSVVQNGLPNHSITLRAMVLESYVRNSATLDGDTMDGFGDPSATLEAICHSVHGLMASLFMAWPYGILVYSRGETLFDTLDLSP